MVPAYVAKSRRYFTLPVEAFHNLTCLHGNILYIYIIISMSTIKLNRSCVIELYDTKTILHILLYDITYMIVWYKVNRFRWYLNSSVNLPCQRHENLSPAELLLYVIYDIFIMTTTAVSLYGLFDCRDKLMALYVLTRSLFIYYY